MKRMKIKEIIAGIMFLDDAESIASDVSLILDLDINSIDMIDLIFELNSTFGTELKNEDIWPVTALFENELFFINGEWTEVGLAELKEKLFLDEEQANQINKNITPNELLKFLTVDFLESLISSKE